MRCPKCGFHSFDHLDNCKKCGGDLTRLKRRFTFGRYAAAPTTASAAAGIVPAPEEPAAGPALLDDEEEPIDFGFGILEEEPPPLPPAAEPAPEGDDLAIPGVDDPSAIDLSAAGDLDFDQPFPDGEGVSFDPPLPALGDLDLDQPFPDEDGFSFDRPFPTAGGLDLDQPFPAESESLPDDDLPKLDDRF